MEVIRTKEGFKGDSAIAELKVHESEPIPGGESPSRPGETVDYEEPPGPCAGPVQRPCRPVAQYLASRGF